MNITFATQTQEYDPRFTQTLEKTPVKPQIEVKDQKSKEEVFKHDKREQLQSVLAEHDISLSFRRDEKTGQVIVEMIDNTTGDAIRQIPSEVSLKLSAAFAKVQGQLFEARV